MRIFLTLSILFSLLLIQTTASACSYAYQYSLFPMGTSMGNLVMLEVELERYVNTPDQMIGNRMPGSRMSGMDKTIETRWKGNLRLKSIAKDTTLLIEELGFVDISDEQYHEKLRPYFHKAMRKAEELPMFERAELLEEGLCKYDNTCDFFKKTIDTTTVNVYCAVNQEEYINQRQEVIFPSIVLHKFENMTKMEFSDIEKVEIDSRLDFYDVWNKYNVRLYQIGDQTIAIYTLGWGQKRYYKETKTEKWRDNLGPVEDYVKGNDVMRHGQRFDFMQWLD
ncbi:MAG: hypothetical protein GY810_17915 [Aureispira sp.]|nr:hypothetical protein [Aureispira sp.]